MASRLARAFPDAVVAPDGRKSQVCNLSEGFRQKPRPLGRHTGSVLMGASHMTSQSARYRVPRSSHVTGRLRVQKVRISSIDFVVKTTRLCISSAFDEDSPVRRSVTHPAQQDWRAARWRHRCSVDYRMSVEDSKTLKSSRRFRHRL